MKKTIKKIFLNIFFVIAVLFGNISTTSAVLTESIDDMVSNFVSWDTKLYYSYALVSETKTWNNVYRDFSSALNSWYSNIIVDEWTFLLKDTITINKNYINISWVSKDKSILIMTDPWKDLMRVYANNVTVKNLTLDTKTYNAQAAFVVWDWNRDETTNEQKAWNYVTLESCNVLWWDKIFTLYYAWPTYRNSIFKRYSQWKLSSGNVVRNNYFEWRYIRDTFVFWLQKNWKIENNIFVWWELDAYMVVNSSITANTFKDSNKAWIFISWPSYKLNIINNVISWTKEHWIKSFYQINNSDIPEDLKYIKYTTITWNNISNTWETWIDLNYFMFWTVYWNNISNTWIHWISLITNSYNNSVTSNVVSNFWQSKRFRWSWIFATDKSKDNNINSNIITSNKNNIEYAWIFVETNDSINSTISSNSIEWSFLHAWIFSYTKNIKILNNKITNYNWEEILIKE